MTCKAGTHKWRCHDTWKDVLYVQLLSPAIGPWYRCTVCGMATTKKLQPKGWNWRNDESPDPVGDSVGVLDGGRAAVGRRAEGDDHARRG